MRANTQRTERGMGPDGCGTAKTVENRDIRRSVEWRGMGRGTWGIQDGHYRDYREPEEVKSKDGVIRRNLVSKSQKCGMECYWWNVVGARA